MRICCELKNKCIVSDNPKVILSLACSSVSLHFWWWRLFLKEEGAWKLLMKVPEVLPPFNSQKVPILRQVFALLICSQLQALCMTYIKLSCFFFFFFFPDRRIWHRIYHRNFYIQRALLQLQRYQRYEKSVLIQQLLFVHFHKNIF